MSPVPAQMGSVLEYLPPELREKARDYFVYAVDFLPLTADSADSDTISIQNDSDFLIVAATAIARDPADPATRFADPPITARIEDTGSGRNLENRAIDWASYFGDAELPFYLPYPKLIDRASTITTTLTNLDAAQDFDVRVAYHGFKIFNWTPGAGRGA